MNEGRYHTILLPPRPQVDTIIAVFLLRAFGESRFPGIKDATLTFAQTMPDGMSADDLFKSGTLCIDIGKSFLDHHAAAVKTTASTLIAEHLEIQEVPAIQKMLEVARRDDFYGKGIVSDDALDRAFGLPGLIVNLNKQYPQEPARVVVAILPLLEAHYAEELQRTEGLPKAFEELRRAGTVEMLDVKQGDKKLHVIMLTSDNPSFAGYLRSQLGGRHDVVAQWLSSGHVNILTRPTKHIRLKSLAALLRLEEAQRAHPPIILATADLGRNGRLNEIPEWYYDPATNSLQNGGINPQNTPATKIPKADLLNLLEIGLAEAVPGLPR